MTDAGPVAPEEYPGAVWLAVPDVRAALQCLATHHRNAFSIPIIGITGSNGKTMVKEWLFQLLEPDLRIARSPKSFNSKIGVPISVLGLETIHELGIFEAGISEPGEMEILQPMIRPTLGILTNIGAAHDEGFESAQEKIKEKLLLFAGAESLVYCSDDAEIRTGVEELGSLSKDLQFFSWSRRGQAASLGVTGIEKVAGSSSINAQFQGSSIGITIPFTDDASIENAITCWCSLLCMGYDPGIAAQRMLDLHPVEMRLELKQGINNCSVINDSYSADINSLKIALDFLQQQKQHAAQTVILSDILQSGMEDEALYKKVASLLKQKNISRLIAIGPRISSQQDLFATIGEKYFFLSAEDFMAQAKEGKGTIRFNDETILLKGARNFRFELISRMLEEKVHETIISIDLGAVSHNCKVYQDLLKPRVKMMVMVKAFSYGSGSFEIANQLRFNHVDYLAVAYADEGVELRKNGISLPIMVMNPEAGNFSTFIEYNLEPEIYSFTLLGSLEKYLHAAGIQYFPVHIKLDTGMHRLGFEPADVDPLAERLSSSMLKVQSVFSHLSAADEAGAFTQHQAEVFFRGCERLQAAIPYPFLRHIANTTALSRHPHLQLDMVRLGIGLYGVDGDEAIQKKLRNVSTLTTTISQIKKVVAGDRVGYGGETILEKDSMIATVRIGYADGYPRALSRGRGKMLLHGKYVPVVGNVCMDMTMLDVTGRDAHEGDKVTVFGDGLPVQLLAEWCNTIPYEIMTGISQRVRRVYFDQ